MKELEGENVSIGDVVKQYMDEYKELPENYLTKLYLGAVKITDFNSEEFQCYRVFDDVVVKQE